MTLRLLWTESARRDLHEVLDFLAERNTTIAGRVAVRTLDRLESLRAQPWSAPPWRPANDPSFRRLVIDDIIVVDRVFESDEKLVLLSVRHGRRRPITVEEVAEESDQAIPRPWVPVDGAGHRLTGRHPLGGRCGRRPSARWSFALRGIAAREARKTHEATPG